MATLAELKARIIAETGRDDLGTGEESEDILTTAIARAVEYHSDEQFWFNRGEATANTVAATATVAVPAAIREPEVVWYQNQALRKVPLASLEGRTETGLPSSWAAADGLIQLWPIPNAIYALTIAGVAQIDAPDQDAEETVWLHEAYDLIAARVRLLLYRDAFRDTEGANLAAQAEIEALNRLRRETRRRGVTPLQATGDEPWTARSTFNINMGY